ncbi:PAS domain S-box protein [Flammeovirgaceae bacterium SG7u.111]|nr:PAS domain S-box protein [Flammeovirgaceae bacterium SG7u.132]WPO36145.1 PAS domain S-box protein [Flammeovirgaceae bacterium SG7u.111]
MDLLNKTKEELIEEVLKLRQQASVLEHELQHGKGGQLPDMEGIDLSEYFVYKHHLDGRIFYASKEARKLLQLEKTDGTLKNVKDVISKKGKDTFKQHIEKVLKFKQQRGYLKTNEEEGESKVIEFVSSLVDDGTGEAYVRGIGKDVTFFFESRKWLRASHDFYKKLFQHNNNMILLLEETGTIIDVNETVLKQFDLKRADVAGQNIAKVLEKYGIKIKYPQESFLEVIKEKGKIWVEGISVRQNNRYFVHEYMSSHEFYENHRLIVVYGRDITEQQKTETDNKTRYEELKVFNDAIRNVLRGYEINHILIQSLKILSRLKYVAAVGLCTIEETAAELLFQFNFPQPLAQLIKESKLEEYQEAIDKKEAFEVPSNFFGDHQEVPLLFVPVNIEGAINYYFIFQLTDALDRADLHLQVLVTEISSHISQAKLKNKLSQSEIKFKTMANNAPALLRMATSKGEFEFYSDQWMRFTGQKDAEKLKNGWLDSVHPLDKEKANKIYDFLKRRQKFELSYRLRKSNGQYSWILETGTPYYDDYGLFDGFVASAIDITIRKEREKENSYREMVRYSEERLQFALKNALMFAITIDHHGMMMYCNQFLQDITGWQEEELVGKSLFNIFNPSLENVGKLKTPGFLETFEGKLKTKDGDKLSTRFNSIVLNDQKGDIVSMTIVGEDISEQVKVTKALHETNQLLQDLFDSANDLIMIFDESGKFLFVNNSWKSKLEFDDEDLKKIRIDDIIDAENHEATLAELQKAKIFGELRQFDTVFNNKSGKKINLRGSLSCNREPDKPYLYRAILYDYTDRLRAEKAEQLYYQLAKLVEKGTPLDELYFNFYELLNRAIGVDSFVVVLREEKSNKVTFASSYRGGKETEEIPCKYFAQYATWHLERPMFLYNDNILHIVGQKGLTKDSMIPEVWLGVPLMLREKVVGMLIIQSFKNKKQYNKRDLELLTFVSGQLADAILRYQNELEITSQKARLEAILESGSHLMWSIDTSYKVTRFNQNFTDTIWQYFHFLPIQGVPVFRAFGGQGEGFLRFWYEKYSEAFSGIAQQFEMKFLTENGEEHWREIFLNPVYGSEFDIVEISGVAHDITQKKVTELGLAESEEKFRNIFESFQDVYFRIDMSGVITMISPSISDLIGEGQIEVLGKPITNYMLSDFKLHYLMKELLNKGNVRNYESGVRTKKGDLKITISNFRLIRSPENGDPHYVEGVARDITSLKHATEELRKAKDIAEKSLEVKKRFLSNMSHEIRTPMNGIIGMIDLLNETRLNNEQSEFVHTIKKSSETLLNILNDILDLSKIEAGKMELRPMPLSLEKLLEKLYALFVQQAMVHDTRLTYEISEGVHKFVEADETRLLQVLSNLTSNAIKFTHGGTIHIRVDLVDTKENEQELSFWVVDTGIGISKENLELLFKQFSQVENSYTKSHGGTGLGLAISRQLCVMMGGDIHVESILGKGSTFWFTIKVDKCKESDVEEKEQESLELPGKVNFEVIPKILLVDDNMVNLSVAGKILKKAGCDVSVSLNGAEAIEMVKAKQYDLVLMDIQMPEMDGVAASNIIRGLGLDYELPIIAMTAFSMQEEREEFLGSGMDDYISKPIKASILLSKVSKWCGNNHAENEEEIPATNGMGNEVLNVATANELRKYGGDEILLESYQEFEHNTKEILGDLVDAILSADRKETLSQLHTLKGNASTLGVEKVANMAAFVEGKLKAGEYVDLVQYHKKLTENFTEFKKVYKNILKI